VSTTLESWLGDGTQGINAGISWTAGPTWQTYSLNLGDIHNSGDPIPPVIPTGATWRIGFGIYAWKWSTTYNPDTLVVDNIRLTLIPEPCTFALLGLGAAALLISRRRR
jgi:hypothetical protein